MNALHQKCAVCGRFTTEFNYSVLSCNSCKIFFRRLIVRTVPIKKCFRGERCFEKTPYIFKCTSCRFQKCLYVGMTLPSYLLVLEQNKEQRLAITIDCVRNTHNKRMDSLFNFFVTEMNPNVDDIVELNKITYTKRDEHIRMDFQTWAFHSCVTTIDFMKQFPFVNLLRSTDQMILLKESYVKLGALISATRAYSSKKQCISFPDGTDCLPKTQWTVPKISPNLENRIRCRVIDKLRELNIQNDEFYLLSVLLFCNPAITNLSENGQLLLTSYQKMYSSALLYYCLLTYQKSGPSRFSELLGLFTLLGQHYDDIIHYYVLMQLNQSEVELKKLVKDGIEAAYKS